MSLAQFAAAIRQVQASVPTFRTATVTTNFATPDQTYVTLDNDPTLVPVRAISSSGVFPQGARVAVLVYPPRGLDILGRLDGDGSFYQLYLNNNGDASPTSTTHELQIGPTNGANLRLDANEIMAVNNGVKSSLFINADGGLVGIGTNPGWSDRVQFGPSGTANININFNQVWALTNGVGSTLFLNFSSGNAPVQIGDGTAAGAGLLAFVMRAKQIFAASPTFNTTASYVNSTGAISGGITLPACPSGRYVVHIRCAISNTTAGNGQCMSFNIRTNNGAGALQFTGSDGDALIIRQQVVSAGQIYGGVSIYVTIAQTSGTIFLQPTDRQITAGSTPGGQRLQYIIQPQP